MVCLTAAADRGYRVAIRPGHFQSIQSPLSDLLDSRKSHWIVISDETVAALYLEPFLGQLKSHLQRIDSIVVPTGEPSKSVAQCQAIWEQLVEIQADRKSTIVALGGGVIGDLAGFVAASFGRGLDFIQIPTTLLAQVDSSVGGKVGINLPTAKNIIGAFWQPRRVVIDPDLLATLEDRDYRCGLAEVVKYGMILDANFFGLLERSIEPLESRDSQSLALVIQTCCQLKADVVQSDERETSGRRAILNYGHTFGHAVEAVYGYGTWRHGEAVAMGMTCAARLAVTMNLLPPEVFQRQTELLRAIGLPTDVPDHNHDQLLAAMKRDKKVSHGSLNLILPRSIGQVELVPAPDDDRLLACLQNDY